MTKVQVNSQGKVYISNNKALLAQETGDNAGIPREVVNGVYQSPASTYNFSLPSNATTLGRRALSYAFAQENKIANADLSLITSVNGERALNYAFQNSSIVSLNLSNLETIQGYSVASYMCQNCSSLISVNLDSLKYIKSDSFYHAFDNCTALTSIDLSSLEEITSGNACEGMFQGCNHLASVDLSNLRLISGSACMASMFRNCILLSSLSFPALNSNSFGTNTTQFNNMLQGVTGCTVHFPSNLQSVIGSWASVTSGFGGTNTTVLFDLPATT